MLSSITSMLPSGIGFGAKEDKQERERASDENTPRPHDYATFPDKNDGEKEGDHNTDELGVKKKRERNPYETFIVVRPPPSVSNHPLNLQLQLVPPQAKERAVSGSSTFSGTSTPSNRRSMDITASVPDRTSGEARSSLDRTASLRSNRSDPSLFYASTSASTASMSSISSISTSNSAGGRRMIVPLYNLSAHNVMTNTVLDAGTDAKVAKFHKRNLEVLALAVFECIEVWPGSTRGAQRHVTFLHANGANGTFGAAQDDYLRTPTSSAISLSSAGSHPHGVPEGPSTPTPISRIPTEGRESLTPTPSQNSKSAKKIFGKIFKKKDAQNSSGHARMSSVDSSTSMLPGGDAKQGLSSPVIKTINRRSLNSSIPSPSSSHFSSPAGPVGSPPAASNMQVLLPALLGIQPTLSAPVSPPTGRATRYVWIVRRWLKNTDNGLFGGVMRGVGMVSTGIANMSLGERSASGGSAGERGGDMALGTAQMGVELRFEWLRGVSKNRSQKRKSAGQALLRKRSSLPRVDSNTSIGQESLAPRKQKSVSRVRHGNTAAGSPRRSGEVRRSIDGAREESRTRGSPRDSLTSTTLSEEGGSNQHLRGRSAPVGNESEDDGEDSDPEDSETPWTCSLVISSVPTNVQALWENEQMATSDTHNSLTAIHSRPRSHISTDSTLPPSNSVPGVSAASAPTPAPAKPVRPEMPGTLLRLKVGTLSPAPHHPKVVSQLKVPYPLPDIDVTHGRVRRRVITPAGIARPASSRGGDGNAKEPEGLILTAEEIKDVLSCTAFWLVVREGLGGVGKEKRKGDGWRLRG